MVSVLCYVLGRVILVLLPVLSSTYAVTTAMILLKAHQAVVCMQARG